MSHPYAMPGDPNLPPGCTNADIDRAMGGDEVFDVCEWCGEPCSVLETIHPDCLKQERAERKRDEMKDEPLGPINWDKE